MTPSPHIITNIITDSIAAELGITPGDKLLTIDGEHPTDVFDYQYMIMNEYLEILIEKPNGEQWLLEIDKEEDEDLGLEFADGLMDAYRSCRNKCIFCFIDQMPPGMRETLYFKDDDTRLSFLQGNYVTLTNITEAEIDRIIKYRLEPINISFQTTDPQLRCLMLGNRFAGEGLKLAERLYAAGIKMNGQIVLCKGINDGLKLEETIRELSAYRPHLESVSVVPAGLTRYRDGLYPLEGFAAAEAGQVIDTVERFQQLFFAQEGNHFIHAGDEWYLLAGQSLPPAERYDGYLQLENGVGMMRLLLDEFDLALAELLAADRLPDFGKEGRELSAATGMAAYPYLKEMCGRLSSVCAGLTIHLYPIVNNFFGEAITVSGLLTGQDIIRQLSDKKLGGRLLLPTNVLRSDEAVFLDDYTLPQVEKALQVPIDIVKSSGRDLIEAIIRADAN